jgi:predicted CopG family antitoxin
MAFKTLTIKESTYRKISRWKEPGESFSELLDREFDRKIETAADLLAWGKENLGKKTGLSQRKQAKKKAA